MTVTDPATCATVISPLTLSLAPHQLVFAHRRRACLTSNQGLARIVKRHRDAHISPLTIGRRLPIMDPKQE